MKVNSLTNLALVFTYVNLSYCSFGANECLISTQNAQHRSNRKCTLNNKSVSHWDKEPRACRGGELHLQVPRSEDSLNNWLPRFWQQCHMLIPTTKLKCVSNPCCPPNSLHCFSMFVNVVKICLRWQPNTSSWNNPKASYSHLAVCNFVILDRPRALKYTSNTLFCNLPPPLCNSSQHVCGAHSSRALEVGTCYV